MTLQSSFLQYCDIYATEWLLEQEKNVDVIAMVRSWCFLLNIGTFNNYVHR